VTTLQKQALEQPEEIQRWEVVLAAVEQADPAGDPRTEARLLALQKEIHTGLDAAHRDKALLDRWLTSARRRPTIVMEARPTPITPVHSARPESTS